MVRLPSVAIVFASAHGSLGPALLPCMEGGSGALNLRRGAVARAGGGWASG